MKIKVFDNIKKIFNNDVSLKKLEEYNETLIVNDNSCNIHQKYMFIVNKDNTFNLYTYPDFRLLSGNNIYGKDFLKSIECVNIYDREDLSGNITSQSNNEFNRALDNFTDSYETNSLINNAIHYLQSLYYRNDNIKEEEDFNKLFNKLKEECKKNNIEYEKDINKIINKYLDNYKEKEDNFSNFSSFDLSMCSSCNEIDNYINKKINEGQNLDNLRNDLFYIKGIFNSSIISGYLIKSYYLNDLFSKKSIYNKKDILKSYMEFFIASRELFKISRYLDNKKENITNKYMKNKLDDFYNNEDFINNLKDILDHDKDKYIYRYHATASKDNCEDMLNNGFYLFSDDLDSTSFPELSLNQLLTYEYGNGYKNYGDYIVIIREDKDKNIIRELSEEEKDLVQIDTRRDSLIGHKPNYVIESNNIVGYIDKEHKKVIKNSELDKNKTI